MRFLNTIPRGLVIFIVGIVLIIAIVVGYRFLAGGASGTNGGGGSNGLFSALFPFGGGGAPNTNTQNASSSPLTQTQTGTVPVLRQVDPNPVAGAWFTAGAASTSAPRINYMERETGHVTQTPADAFDVTRISNTTLPGIEELYAAGGLSLIIRYLDASGTIKNLYGAINASSSEQTLTTSALPPFNRIAVEPGGNMLTVTVENGAARVDMGKSDGSKMQTLFTSPITSWVPLLGGATAFLETAPTAAAPGYVYEIKGGTLKKIGGGQFGMTALVSPSGRYVATSGNGANGFVLSVVDTKSGTVLGTPVHALALTCAWIVPDEPLLFCAVPVNPPSASYPDDWLFGNVSFSDQAWIVNPSKSTAYFIGDLTDANGTGIDAENISVDPTGTYALFTNKKDLSLWSLDIADAVTGALR